MVSFSVGKQEIGLFIVFRHGLSPNIMGVMIESNLVEGRQDIVPGQPLTYGQSVTDACISWEDTVPLLDQLARSVRDRRARNM